MSDLRILFLNGSPGWGGMEMHPLIVADGLSRRGHLLLFGMRARSRMSRAAGGRRFQTVFLPFRWYLDPSSYLPLRRVARGLGINVVHVHSSTDTWRAMLLAGVLRRTALLVFSKHSGTPPASTKRDPLHRLLVRRLDAMVANSSYIRRNILETYPIEASKVVVIHYGLEDDVVGTLGGAERVRRSLGLSEKGILVGMVASLSEGKRQDLFVEAASLLARSYPGVRFLIVGGTGHPGYAKRVKTMIRTLGLEGRVLVTGFLDDIPSLMQALDILVLPSNEEAFGIVLLEAMANGKPIVGSRSGAIPEIVRHEQEGLLFAPGSGEALAEAIKRLLRSPEERTMMGERGRERFLERFRLDREVDETERLYRRLLSERPLPGGP